MIQSIIDKEYLQIDNIKMIFTECPDKDFQKFIYHIFPLCSMVNIKNIFYNINNPNIIICNNRIDLNKSIEIANFFHIPLLLVDHTKKNEKVCDIPDINFKPFYSVAISTQVYNSWNKTQSKMLGFDIYDENNIKTWQNIILDLSKKTFRLKEI